MSSTCLLVEAFASLKECDSYAYTTCYQAFCSDKTDSATITALLCHLTHDSENIFVLWSISHFNLSAAKNPTNELFFIFSLCIFTIKINFQLFCEIKSLKLPVGNLMDKVEMSEA
ncbi:CLUMA_CG006791, isoform A [Clunio marinus]|uniref:CLUMA_CG006791, isoform A n=1 Tax=Clunio marinus TaxID=568069 RepID=A0A1J1HYR7_9DIPT|nr:CLUMA_CG006791, isoform A [Clunio marinus]